MWARSAEIVIGLWLIASPLVFERSQDAWMLGAVDLGAGAAAIAVATLSFWPSLRRMHLLSVLVGTGLIAFGRFVGERSPASENEIFVGLLLVMFAIIPSQASKPPVAYRERQPKPT